MPTERALGAHREYIRQPDGSWRVDPWDGRTLNDKVEGLLDFLGMRGGVPLSAEAALTSIAITLRQLLARLEAQEREAQRKAEMKEAMRWMDFGVKTVDGSEGKPKPTEVIHLPEGVTQKELVEALQYVLGGNFRGWPT